MALGATLHAFTVRLSHVDRNLYETLELRLARHPSETAEFLVTRLLAYCLELTEGITFSKGLSDPDEPAIVVRDLTGALRAWIEVGAPEAPRLHALACDVGADGIDLHKRFRDFATEDGEAEFCDLWRDLRILLQLLQPGLRIG